MPGSYLLTMRTAAADTPRICFEPCGSEWMVATIDGTRLSCAPIRNDELIDAVVELVTRLGEPTLVEVRHVGGVVRRAVIDPANPTVSRMLTRSLRSSIHLQLGARMRSRLVVFWLVVALAVVLVSIFLLGRVVGGVVVL